MPQKPLGVLGVSGRRIEEWSAQGSNTQSREAKAHSNHLCEHPAQQQKEQQLEKHPINIRIHASFFQAIFGYTNRKSSSRPRPRHRYRRVRARVCFEVFVESIASVCECVNIRCETWQWSFQRARNS